MFDKMKDKLENIIKFCNINLVSGKDKELQKMQVTTLRNVEDALKVGQFGFNSKAPTNSRGLVVRVGNENIVISNEHFTSIIDVASGDTVIYNETGTNLELKGTDMIATCSNFLVNASSSFIVNSPINQFNGGTVKNDGVNIGKTHTHPGTLPPNN